MNQAPAAARPRQKRVIGVLGGMGPRAHVLFEEHLLSKAVAVLGAKGDADFPAWVLASFPATPDRTRALCSGGESPLPAIRDALGRLASAGAGFAVVACLTSHAFLEREGGLPLPVLSLSRTVARAAAASGATRVGLLATSGTLAAGVFQKAFAAVGVACVSPLDLPDGEKMQAELVMAAIYGPGGIKADGPTPMTAGLLLSAGEKLAAAGADALVMGCTEISFVADRLAGAGLPLLDPLAIGADAAIRYAYGLPAWPLTTNGDGAVLEKCFL